MPVSFTPDLIPRRDETFLRYININMQRLKQSLLGVPRETISTTAPGSPYIGQTYTNPTLGIDYVWNGTIWVPVNHWGPGTLHTPVWTQSGTISKTVVYSNWFKEGRKISGSMHLQATSGGTSNVIQTVTAPEAASVASSRAVGSGYFNDNSLGVNTGLIVYLSTTTTFAFVTVDASYAGSLGTATSGNPNAVASPDAITFTYEYESAA